MSDLSSFEIREGHNSNNRYYDGYIQKYALTKVLELNGFKLKCIDDFTIHLHSQEGSAIYICINLAQKASLKLNCEHREMEIPPFASVLVPFNQAQKISFKCKSNKDYNFLALKVHHSHLDREQVALLENLQDRDAFLNLSNSQILMPNLAICEMARKLKQLEKETCENKFIARGYCNILIGMKLKEFLPELSISSSSHLRDYEIEQLEWITDRIKENPENEYSIDGLCKTTGLSVSKLQAGFKEMHDCTVAIFIRNVRLEKALDMLRNTNLNVSEIVYSVGLSSRSYFCRIFKNRFKCSPKFYQQKLKQSNLVAL